MDHRIHNFSAGPGALPLPLLEEIRAELVNFRGAGTSLLEQSHRGPIYDEIHHQAMNDLASLLGCVDTHKVLFMGGGARSQFAFVPMNLLSEGGHADYISTGRWSDVALQEAQCLGIAKEAWTSKETGHDRVPAADEFPICQKASYIHFTSNNTVCGTEYHYDPDPQGKTLVCDMSSDLLSRPVDMSRYGIVYAGAQKNCGPAGVTLVFVRNDVFDQCVAGLPAIFSYPKLAEKDSMLNTPPVFPIYVVGLIAKDLLARGGLAAAAQRAHAKAETLYGVIDGSAGFYRGHAQRDSRSLMNVTFRIRDEALEPRFAAEAEAAGLEKLKGHRSVGGLRASIYNAVPQASVDALCQFMEGFAKTHR